MKLVLQIPDEVAKQLSSQGEDLTRRALEALAVEGYRRGALTLHQVSQMLGVSRTEAEDFLGRRHVPLSKITERDLDREAAVLGATPRRSSR